MPPSLPFLHIVAGPPTADYLPQFLRLRMGSSWWQSEGEKRVGEVCVCRWSGWKVINLTNRKPPRKLSPQKEDEKKGPMTLGSAKSVSAVACGT